MNSQQTKMILYAIIAFLVWKCWSSRNTSGYSLSMRPITITTTNEGSIFDLPNKMECVPGPEPTTSPYTIGLTPGGLCGAQELVAAQGGGYTITGGIGIDEPAPAPAPAGNIISTGN